MSNLSFHVPLLQAPSPLLTLPNISIAQHLILLIVFNALIATSYTSGKLDVVDRIRDHLSDIRKNDLSKPVSRHFNSSIHSISNFVAFGLSIINGSNDCRKTIEMQLILAVSTLNPHVINERFTFG